MGRLDITTLGFKALWKFHASREDSNNAKQPWEFWEGTLILILYMMDF